MKKMDPKHKPWIDRDEDEGYDGYSADDGEEGDGEDAYVDSDYDY